jgi:predicted nucleic-acid-binding protein
MKVAVDTNVLVRLIVNDDKVQAKQALRLLSRSTAVYVSLPTFCEFFWVLRSFYQFSDEQIGLAINNLLNIQTLETDRPAVEAGLSLQRNGGDFADGVIAFDGLKQGAEAFYSFDKKAVKLLNAEGFRSSVVPSVGA